jgi:Fe-S-cluster containining protein
MSWYKEGLRFGCTECGKCCSGSPGYVWLDDDEIVALAKRLCLSVEEFIKRYTRKVGRRYSLLEKGSQYDCIFLLDKRCQVYEERPKQCRSFPWWKENIESEKSWEETKGRCEGIDHPNAPLFPAALIDTLID